MAAQLHSQRAEIALLRGDGAGGRRELHAARAAAGPVGDGPPALWELPLLRGEAELALATGDPAAAADRVTRALRLAHGAPHERWAAVLTGCRAAAHPSLVHGHPATAASLRASLDAAADGLPRGSPALAAYALQFDTESGTGDGWAAAAAAWQARGHVVATAYCLARAGQAALATDRAGAQDHLARALEAAGRAGASALAEQVRVIARSAHLTLPGRTGASGTHRPLGLTSRELEVLGMVADGWSNKRIATALYVSPKTVSVHVRSGRPWPATRPSA